MTRGEAQAYEFELFVANHEVQTRAIMHAVERELERVAPGRYHLTLVNVLENPERAIAAKVFATPMLIRHLPAPPVRILGDFSDSARVLRLLGVEGTTGDFQGG